MSQYSVSGAMSGIDTASLVNQLINAEGAQQRMLSTRQNAAQKAADAYSTLITSLNSLGDKAKALADTSKWVGSTATSSSTSVTAEATGTVNGQVRFDVTQLATQHSLISSTSVAARSDIVASGSITLTNSSGTATSIDVGDGSLASVASALNDADAGVSATVVQTSPGAYKLQVAATETGSASAFTISGLSGFSSMDVLSQGSDASITVGTNPATAYSVTSTTNTFNNIVDGLSFTVGKIENGVLVSAAPDGSDVADKISELVDETNKVLSNLASQSARGTGKSGGGALEGEAAIRMLTQRILSSVGGQNAPGTSLTRDGRLEFDKSDFIKAFQANPGAVADAYGAKSTFSPTTGVTGSAEVIRTNDTTAGGTYGLTVSVAALPEQWQLEPPGALIAGRTIVVQRAGQTISYTAGLNESMQDVSAALSSRLARAGFGVVAAEKNGGIRLTSESPGSSQAFSATIDQGTATQVSAGRDVEGTIAGQTAVGSGNTLTLREGSGGAVGLSVRADVSEADVAATGGNIGDLTFEPGLAQSLLGVVRSATASSTGALSSAKQSRLDAVDDLQTQIDSWTTRLDARRLTLQRQFTAMETALANMQSQTSALAGLFTSN